MSLSWCEEIKRLYNNGVTIIYEIIDKDNIYLHSINSICKKKGYGTETLNNFIKEFEEKNIYIFSSSELGTDRELLNNWYEKLGFIRTENLDHIPYNITHFKKYTKEVNYVSKIK
jgi:hypothetical protein